MGSSVNKIYILGYLGHGPEVRSTASGKTVTTLSVATSEYVGSGQDRQTITQWHKVILWDKLGDLAGRILKKGSRVYVEGKVTYRKYTGRDNVDRVATEIIGHNMIFLDKTSTDEPSSEYAAPAESERQSEPTSEMYNRSMDGTDDIPF